MKNIDYNVTQSTVVLWITSVIANFTMVVALGRTHIAMGWHMQWVYLVLFALASVIASWTLVKGVKFIDADAAGILGLLEIVFGIIFGVVFFHEKPGVMVLAGALVIMVAAAIPYLRDYNTQRGTLG